MIIVKLQTCSSDKSNFPFKNLFFNCYFFVCSKSFSVLSECFTHNIATLLYLPPKIHRPTIAHRPATFYTPQGGSFCTLILNLKYQSFTLDVHWIWKKQKSIWSETLLMPLKNFAEKDIPYLAPLKKKEKLLSFFFFC